VGFFALNRAKDKMDATMGLRLIIDVVALLNCLYALTQITKKRTRVAEDKDDPDHPLPGGKKRKIAWKARPRKDEDGNLTHDYSKRNYAASPWGQMLLDTHVNGPRNPNSILGKDFRRDFAVPYKVFAYILYLAEKRGWGGGALDAVGLSGAPLDLNTDFSENIGHVRKDIECVFGRLKRRFRWMLNGRIEIRNREDVDNSVFTYVLNACAVLHGLVTHPLFVLLVVSFSTTCSCSTTAGILSPRRRMPLFPMA
jgi:hypothetical protein